MCSLLFVVLLPAADEEQDDEEQRYDRGAGGLEKERGMIREGMVADLVVLSTLDPKTCPVVNETWKDGEIVYRRSS